MATRKLEVLITGDASQLEKALGKVSGQAQGFGGAMKKAAIPATAALGALAIGAKKATDQASGLNESINAVNVVFGKAAPKIHKFAQVAAQEAGLSMRQLNELVTPVGAALQNVGFSADEAAKQSINLAKRAADMASVFNVDVSQALEAIQAGLRGEADPLERFGVGLSDAAVTAKALEMGLAETTKEITANDKATARLSLIMSQSERVAGDFKNTSGELANQQRINAAQTENQTAKLGQGLLPVMQTFQGLLKSTTAFLSEHTTATKVAVGIVAGLAAGVLAVNAGLAVYRAATVAATAAQVAFNAALVANPIGLVVVALAALAAGVLVAYQRSETFRKIVDGLWQSFKDLGGWIQKHWGTIGSIIEKSPMVLTFKLVAGYVERVVDGIKWLIKHIPDIPKFDLPSLPDLTPGFNLRGDGGSVKPPPASGGINLMGARPEMMPFAIAAQGLGLRVTSGLRPGAITANGTPSDHGIGKALDVAGSSSAMASFFKSLVGNGAVKQAFYDPLGSIFGGALSSYREGGHSDHVHVATYDRGGALRPGWNLAYNGLGRNEALVAMPHGGGGDIVIQVDGETLARVNRRYAEKHARRNAGA